MVLLQTRNDFLNLFLGVQMIRWTHGRNVHVGRGHLVAQCPTAVRLPESSEQGEHCKSQMHTHAGLHGPMKPHHGFGHAEDTSDDGSGAKRQEQ